MGTQTFSYTGADQTFAVPAGVTTVTVDAQGAEGGQSGNQLGTPGKGGRVVCDLTVTPGETLHITVGQHPVGANPSSAVAGWPDGGAGGSANTVSDGGGGGGSSDVRQGGTAVANRVVVAGGGGGQGGNDATFGHGGDGGGGNGNTGSVGDGNGSTNPSGGVGATTSAGGAAGASGGTVGTAGLLALGGAGGNVQRGGAGGGGGKYGGGGGVGANNPGQSGGGGGGGSGLGTGVNQTLTSGYRSGNGQVILTWTVAHGDHVLLTDSSALLESDNTSVVLLNGATVFGGSITVTANTIHEQVHVVPATPAVSSPYRLTPGFIPIA